MNLMDLLITVGVIGFNVLLIWCVGSIGAYYDQGEYLDPYGWGDDAPAHN
jgi:hypothetical protein